jgi:hypothetical protein
MITLISGGKDKAQQMLEARWWIADYSPKDEPDLSEKLTDEEVIKVVDQHYYGGWKQFSRDIESSFVAD